MGRARRHQLGTVFLFRLVPDSQESVAVEPVGVWINFRVPHAITGGDDSATFVNQQSVRQLDIFCGDALNCNYNYDQPESCEFDVVKAKITQCQWLQPLALLSNAVHKLEVVYR